VRRPRAEEAIVCGGLALIALALFVPWWDRPAEEGETTPLTWLSPATNIDVPLFGAAGLALALLVVGAVLPSPRLWRRLLWLVPLVLAGLAFLVALIELAYLEVFDDAELGMPLGLLGIAVLGAGCLVSIVRGAPTARH
jgi:hypothetical protein